MVLGGVWGLGLQAGWAVVLSYQHGASACGPAPDPFGVLASPLRSPLPQGWGWVPVPFCLGVAVGWGVRWAVVCCFWV